MEEEQNFQLIDWDDEELENFIRGQQAQNTLKGIAYAANVLKRFCQSINEERDFPDISPDELDRILSKFFMTIKKKNGDPYEPGSLSTIQRGIQKHFDLLKMGVNVLIDDAFEKSRQVLVARRKQLVKQGLGNKPNATRELDTEEIEKLFTSGYFGCDDPTVLQRAMWWFISLHFGFRARDEARKLCWGDVVLETKDGKEYLRWICERGTKTRVGNENETKRAFDPVVYASNTDQCPVMFYKIFRKLML